METTQPLDLSLEQLAEAMTHCFEGYVMPAHFTAPMAATMIRVDAIDLASSLIAREGDEIIGAALISRRGRVCRVAAMAVAMSARRTGVGKAILTRAIEEARGRGEVEMQLEVIEQNPPAIELYKQLGFQIVHRLIGFEGMLPDAGEAVQPALIGKPEKPPKKKPPATTLKDSTFAEVAAALRKRGPLATSWSLSPATVEQLSGPSRAVRCGEVFAMIGLAGEDVVSCRALGFAKEPSREAIKIFLAAVAHEYPGKKFFIPAFFPEPEYKDAFEDSGLKIGDISQFQMSLKLGA